MLRAGLLQKCPGQQCADNNQDKYCHNATSWRPADDEIIDAFIIASQCENYLKKARLFDDNFVMLCYYPARTGASRIGSGTFLRSL